MRAAIISDVHGNLAALENVFTAIDAEQPGVDEVRASATSSATARSPGSRVARVLDRSAICLAGNHDLARRRIHQHARCSRTTQGGRPMDART